MLRFTNYYLILLLFCHTTINGQHLLSGKVIDLQNGNAISDALIFDNTSKLITTSDETGLFFLKSRDSIIIEASGYLPEKIRIRKRKSIVVALQSNPQELQKVVITSFSNAQRKDHHAQQIAVIPSEMLLQGDRTDLTPLLNAVPGVFMQSGALNTNRITIRGIGSRNPFGTIGIRTFYDDIPLTDGNGASAIEDLELAALSRIEVHKGPAASSFGAGLGGAILLIPEKVYNTTKASVAATIGSFGLQRMLATVAHGSEKKQFTLLYGHTQKDGYRENNTYRRHTITSTATLFNSIKNTVRFAGSYVDLKAFIPSALDFNTFVNTPNVAAPTWKAAQGFEDAQFGIAGLSWTHQYKSTLQQKTSFFTSFKANDESRPFNILAEQSFATGVKSRLNGYLLADHQLKWILGGELFLERASLQTYQNLYRDFPSGTGSVQGNLLTDLKENRHFYNVFMELHYQFLDAWKLSVGLNANQTQFNSEDQITVGAIANNGKFNFDLLLSPRVSLVYTPTPLLNIFGTIAHGFNTPTTEETLLPNGIFNPNLQPEQGWNFEIGSHLQGLQNKLNIDASIYLLEVSNLLVNRRGMEDEFFAVNAGQTRHFGIECSATYDWIQNSTATLKTVLNTSINNFKFRDFIDLDNNYSGNTLTGTPSQISNISMQFRLNNGIFGNINYQYVSKIAADDANTIYTEPYTLINSQLGYKHVLLDDFHLELYAGVQNLLDQRYASQLQVNARGFGNNAPRYFYPGNPINFYGGININYRL